MIEAISNVDIVYSVNVDKPKLVIPIELESVDPPIDLDTSGLALGIGINFDGSC